MKGIIIIFSFFAFHTTFSQTVTLRDTTNQYDYIIITVPEFVSACEPFKQHKETVRGFNTLIVDTAQIFAEFDSSSTPQDNIRDFISYAGTFWREPRTKFILIIGNVTAVPNFPVLYLPQPVIYFQSDYYYTQNIYENDSTTTDFYVGRIPAKNANELGNYFSKVIQYEGDNTLSEWMNNNLFICENDVQFGFLDAAISIAENYLPDFMRSYYIVDDSSSIHYGNKDSIYKAINERGNSVVWFEGNNSDTFCVRPDFFNLSDLADLNNSGMPFVTIYVGGQSSIIDTNTNMTREMLVVNNAGSMGGFVFIGLGYWGIIKTFQNLWAQRLFNTSIGSVGEAFYLDSLPSAGIYGHMKQVNNLWADPSLKLKYDVTVDVEDFQEDIPADFTLHQNYPNPFNPSTKIKFTVPQFPLLGGDGRGGLVTLKVYDVLGKEIVELVNEEKPAGAYEVEFNATGLPSGVYFYQLRAGSFVEAKKMILLR